MALGVLLYVIFSSGLLGQNKDIVIDPPNEDFLSIKLQTYNGLPRLGILDYSDLQSYNQIGKDVYRVNLSKYFLLLEMKYLSDAYNALDAERPTTPDSPILSRSIENHLRKIVALLAPNEVINKYLWGAGNYRSNNWNGNTVIEQKNSYREFMEVIYPDLRGWANNLWENNEQYGYLVSQTTLGAYNMQNQGYIIAVTQEKINDGHYVYNSKYVFRPLKKYEKSLQQDNKYFFGYPEDKASILENKLRQKQTVYGRAKRHVYLVQKIRLYRGSNMFNDRNLGPQVEILYSIEDPVIEIFEDMALSHKLGDLNIDEF